MTPFGLHFAAMTAGPADDAAPSPSLWLSAPDSGWIRWRIGDGETSTTIRMSAVFSPLVDIWVWADAIAHRLLPVVLRIDEEGIYTDLHADWSDEGRDTLRLTVLQTDAYGEEYRRLAWHEDRSGWLARLGGRFGDYLGAGFDSRAWNMGSDWPVLACHLPWGWPARVAPHTACDWPMILRRGWFFLSLAFLPDPFAQGRARDGDDEEPISQLRFLLVFLRREALKAAWAGLQDTAFPDSVGLDHSLARARDLFDEIELMREGDEVDAGLADALTRANRLRAVTEAFEADFLMLREQVVAALMCRFPLHEGQWLIDECLRPGRIVQVQGDCRVVDWGEAGIATEQGLRQDGRGLWRWPISRPAGSVDSAAQTAQQA